MSNNLVFVVSVMVKPLGFWFVLQINIVLNIYDEKNKTFALVACDHRCVRKL